MNPKPIFNLFSPKGTAQAVARRQLATLAMSLAVLLLIALTACAQVPASAAVVEESLPAVAPVAVTDKEGMSDSTFLAANPELLKAHLPAEVPEMTESDVLAANPELQIARRYTGAIENEGSQSGAYDIHVAALRYKFRHGLGIEADIETEATSSIFLAANPELSIARRYAAPAMANDVRQPGTYHMERLRY